MQRNLKTYIVDDSPLMRERLKENIQEYDFLVCCGEAGTLAEAREGIHSMAPDVVVLDIRMPDGNGISLIGDIKSHHPDMKIIMFTNYPFPQHRKKCMEEGAEYFFNKSEGFDDLFQAMHDIAALRIRSA